MTPEKIVILTGAGISAESGLSTFRDAGGLWAQHRVEDVATPEAYQRDPTLVHAFYNARRTRAAEAEPNAAHIALARLEAKHPGDVLIITQNVDDLHARAGSRNLVHMHGRLMGALCHACQHRWPAPREMRATDPCPACNAAQTRPDIVWFGEVPYGAEIIDPALSAADLFVAIGTSGNVYPAAAYAQHTARLGAHTVQINLEAASNARDFAESHFGPATDVVPKWVESILRR
ncbi:NAD-dependent deacylase [Pseudohalocynthiibacter aestuariivivens]|uniref:NAD-dependent protein deacylase n=1 Tax=Roseovarius pelagicus TaxID=2980108 RepID=A0ABY6DDX4_9RHOB|nr:MULTISPECIES: NAD-dependent deacylase [Rhodobacterales]QIE47091.1 NAD-dependent deacylase [Pseudohalocynthiibacter aestuariivivens]UXX84359.1 NAD-dependent deacylase [Roseovarius pelagicus]